MTSKKEAIEQPTDDPRDAQIAQLNEKIRQLELMNQGLKNLLVQFEGLLDNLDKDMTYVISEVRDQHLLSAGMYLRSVSDRMSSNKKVLGEITKEWKKE